jgi:hypothetical protein
MHDEPELKKHSNGKRPRMSRYHGPQAYQPGAVEGKNKGVKRYTRAVKAAEADLRNSNTPEERRRHGVKRSRRVH